MSIDDERSYEEDDEQTDPADSPSLTEPRPEPVPSPEAAPARADEEEEEGVAIRSRPPIFYFWPTLVASLWFMAYLGIRDRPLPAAAVQAPAAAGADVAAEGQRPAASPWYLRLIPRLPRTASFVVVVLFTFVAIVYLLLHLIFNYSNSRLVEALDGAMARDLFLRQNAMDLFFWALVLFVILSPSYGLLTFLAFHAFGLMTDHKTFTHANLLRRRLFWVVGAMLVAIVVSIVRPSAEATEYDYYMHSGVSGIFCVLLAFNLFVLAFDFNGASLVALVMVVVGVAALVIMLNTFYPPVGEFFLGLRESTQGLQLNSNFYMFYSYVVSLLMVFSGLIAKADYWRITPLSIVHYQGLLVQRNRHYGALVNFHYHLEFPDFFESVLGGWSGTFILQLPREERPEVISDVWYARYYNKKIRQLLERAGFDAD